jgi:hypothetical protein
MGVEPELGSSASKCIDFRIGSESAPRLYWSESALIREIRIRTPDPDLNQEVTDNILLKKQSTGIWFIRIGNLQKNILRCPSLSIKMKNLKPDLFRNVTDSQYWCKHD